MSRTKIPAIRAAWHLESADRILRGNARKYAEAVIAHSRGGGGQSLIDDSVEWLRKAAMSYAKAEKRASEAS